MGHFLLNTKWRFPGDSYPNRIHEIVAVRTGRSDVMWSDGDITKIDYVVSLIKSGEAVQVYEYIGMVPKINIRKLTFNSNS